jgi:hypothetical protein
MEKHLDPQRSLYDLWYINYLIGSLKDHMIVSDDENRNKQYRAIQERDKEVVRLYLHHRRAELLNREVMIPQSFPIETFALKEYIVYKKEKEEEKKEKKK